MDARNRLYGKEAKERAKVYAAIKRGYTTPEEKKAFAIAEKLRRADWLNSLNGLDADERRARLRAFGVFKRKVFLERFSAKGAAKSRLLMRLPCRKTGIYTQTNEERGFYEG